MVGSACEINYGDKAESRHEAIILQKLSIMLLSRAPKITYYAFEKCPLFPKLCHQFCQFIALLDP